VSSLPHILVVEDNELVCGAMRLLFEETGHRVTTVPSIARAVDVASAETVDLMLLDLGLADGDGLQVMRQLAALGRLPAVSVALTGRDEPEIVAACRAAGCQEVLLKPVAVRELIRLTREWLAGS
jgi:CheY-like chemotaxis protein